MKHNPELLIETARELSAFAETAKANGRGKAAEVLAIGADVCKQAAAAFATANGIVDEDSDSAKAVRWAGFFNGCVAASGYALDAECCLFTKEGICKGCTWAGVQWTFHGRRFTCLTRYSVHNWTGRLLDDERAAGKVS